MPLLPTNGLWHLPSKSRNAAFSKSGFTKFADFFRLPVDLRRLHSTTVCCEIKNRLSLQHARKSMKYMMLVYSAEEAWTEAERAECMADSTKLCHELATQGRFLGASPLHPVATATCV